MQSTVKKMFIKESSLVATMKKKLLLSGERRQYVMKEIAIFNDPERLKAALNKLSWRILQLLSEQEMYPMEVAKKLEVHEQKVYYHIRKLARVGIVKVVKEEEKKGAVAKYYKASFPALGVELPFGYQKIKNVLVPSIDEKMKQFLSSFLKEDGTFDGKIIVGSPDPHGPFKARARDGHYAAYLTLFLGQFVDLPEDFPIKLDVDVKAEKEESNNLISVGGPGTNLITQEANEFLPIRFNMMPSKHGFLLGGLVSEKTKNVYTADNIGVIARIPNPWNKEKRIIVLAGNKAVGTKACVLALAKFWKEALKNFSDEEKFAAVIQGFDLDGDGKVDSIEVLE
ncbi:MAG: helix-turn-helix domain-containing protein [Candidatus Bathyarchaeota archaeon]|nr:helix-turn-helix domain-containing protein [Candidatus Bathyarchaeota archaeon]MDH5623568.1 helix-turn-helix domain-containing protein [Candidatus Bathyarchaeota archaeon]MDH5635981.1 helix-turn-helix domain-containing protein [Candidatus Bathyarchaeota archaeon]MDH5702381.1 helix-turn-helix domain-containing protein [Candidatus Bathyarchaeota archaeon]